MTEESVPLLSVGNVDNTDKLSSNNSSLTDANEKDIKDERFSGIKLYLALIGGAIGNLLEWYDFALFGLLANEIGDHFFPGDNFTLHLLEVYGLFAGSYFMRPIGGLLFGYLGDKYGRICALRISIISMSLSSFLIGLLPSYNNVGIISTIMLVILRLIQGISAGGEITGALVYVLEICPKNRRSLFGILVQISSTGILLGSVVIAILKAAFSSNDMKHFGWRIPFLLGIILLFFGIYIRKYLTDSNEFLHIQRSQQILTNPFLYLIKNTKLEMIIVVFTRSFSAICYFTFFVWVPNYLQSNNLRKNNNYVIHNPYIINTIALVLSSVCMIFSGYLGDYYQPRKVLLLFGTLFIVSIVVLFPLLDNTKDKLLVGFEINGISICYGLFVGCLEVFTVDVFYNNINIRYSGVGISYNIANAIFGGLAPLTATLCVEYIGIKGLTVILCIIGCNSLFWMYCKDCLLERRNNYYNNKCYSIADSNESLYIQSSIEE